jgi:hypothetical protein
MIGEPYIDQGKVRVGRRGATLSALQVLDDFDRLFRASCNGVGISELGVECRIVSGKVDCFPKLRDCFVVHVLLREGLA